MTVTCILRRPLSPGSHQRVPGWNCGSRPDTSAPTCVPEKSARAGLLPQFQPGTRWWDPGLSGRRKMHVTVMRRVYQLTTSSVPLPGEDARLYVVAFLPVARVAATDQSPVGSTTVVERT